MFAGICPIPAIGWHHPGGADFWRAEIRMWWLTDHEEPTRQGSRHRQNAPYQRMRTADGYLMIGAAGEPIWVRCAEALGHKEWCDDPRFATTRQRLPNRGALEATMEAVLMTDTTEHWVEVLEAAGVP